MIRKHRLLHVGVHRVRILEHKAVGVVGDLARVMIDRKGAALLKLADAADRVLDANLLRELLIRSCHTK